MSDEMGLLRTDLEIDLVLLGARTLEGMNLKVDLVGRRLVSAGPILAAMAA